MTLLLLQFNNYYNRQIKVYDTMAEYMEAATSYSQESDINFNPGNGISTSVVVNSGTEQRQYDYVVAFEWSEEERNFKLDSRWWVLDAKRNAYGQYTLDLYRDVIADNYEDVVNSVSFIEKATLTNINDPAIYNKEEITFNEIKQREIMIKDESQVPWIVGYVARDAEMAGDITSAISAATEDYQLTVAGISNWAHYGKIYNVNPVAKTTLRVVRKLEDDVFNGHTWVFDDKSINYIPAGQESSIEALGDGEYVGVYVFGDMDARKGYFYNTPENWILKDIVKDSTYQNLLNNFITNNYVVGNGEELAALNGKRIKDTLSNRIYEISIETTSVNPSYAFRTDMAAYQYLLNHVNLQYNDYIGADNPHNAWEYSYTAEEMKVVLKEITNDIKLTLIQERTHLSDQPYDMFCIPAGTLTIRNKPMDAGYRCNGDIAIRIAQEIAVKFDANVYDIQLLPYCPVREMLSDEDINTIVVGGTRSIPIYEMTGSQDKKEISRLIWCDKSKFSLLTYQTIDIHYPTVLQKKIASLTKKHRICSPNYAAAFDFDPQKNNGVAAIQIDCLYKPFSPYIHVAPLWDKNGLYGGNYNDARGLICGGDFSIARVNDAWENYELQNKNYEKTFQRQIENLEITQDIERTSQIVNAFTGTIQGGVTGGLAGSSFGPYGAAAGAIIGTATSFAGGIADYQLSERLRDEAKSLTTDLYGYGLDNIKALPQTIAKVSAFDPNNKLFPFIEVYSCSEKERKALEDKLKYNGMTVMRVGSISEFIQSEPSYIKAQLIRLEIPSADFHLINTIAAELYKGVFI